MTPASNIQIPTSGCVDLHTHSNASDGVDPPETLVENAAAAGLTAFALTDHDTISGIEPAMSAAAVERVTLIPGIELSTEGGGWDLHILGYFIDPTDKHLLEKLIWLVEMRVERARRIVQNLTDVGRPVTLDEVLEYSGGGTVGRPHVARAMIDRGYVSSIGEAFSRFLGRGKPGFADIIKLTPQKAIALINDAGGVAALAHPMSAGDLGAILPLLKEDGLSGMEVLYGEYDKRTRATLADYAREFDLIATGGSDYHGLEIKPGRPLGRPCLPVSVIEQLWDAAPGR